MSADKGGMPDMKLYEYQAKTLFERRGIPTLRSEVASNPEEAYRAASRFGGQAAVKAQVLLGGRGKAGGVKIAASSEEAQEAARTILGMKIKGTPVRKVLVVEAVRILKEFYFALTVDRGRKKVVLIASAAGGVDIEELAKERPEEIRVLPLHPVDGLVEKEAKRFLAKLFGEKTENGPLTRQAFAIAGSLHALLEENDLSLVEINPLALLEGERLAALDAKVVADDNGLFKHPEIESLKNPEEYSDDEIEAKRHGLSFVSMDGNIGCMVNGAGLAMATMDIIKLFGGMPANFLDVGGSSSPEKVVHAFEIITRNPNVEAVLINIFGGITRCDDIARGFVQARRSVEIGVPIVIRLIGTNEKEGSEILHGEGISVHQNLIAAVKEAVSLVSK